MSSQRILFIPADSLPGGISRSYWLARTLARFHDTYLLQWTDPRHQEWRPSHGLPLAPILAFFGSLFPKPSRPRCPLPDRLHPVTAPVMLNAALRRLLGELPARRLARRFNTWSLRRLVRRLQPDVVFHADGCYYFPCFGVGRIRSFADLQDDFDEEDQELLRHEITYARQCFAKCERVYAVSRAACKRFSELLPEIRFEWLPNGADFSEIRGVGAEPVAEVRQRWGLDSRFTISFIGGTVWFDVEFAQSLAAALRVSMPHAALLLVGNLPRIEAGNVISTGFVPPQETPKYFLASDVGIHLKDSTGSRFLYHSIPLKIIQYAAARKPFLGTRICWVEENCFPNIWTAPFKVDAWIAALGEIAQFRWTNECERAWEPYDWDRIASKLALDFFPASASR